MKKAIFITGGAGFIGVAMARKLGSKEPIVVIDSLLPQVHPQEIRPLELDSSVNFYHGDVALSEIWDEVLGEWSPSTILHLAAETGTGQSLTEASRHGHANVMGTTRMLDALSKRALVPDHIILSSSRAVYGEGAWLKKSGEYFYPRQRKNVDLANALWNPIDDGVQLESAALQCAQKVFPSPTSVYGATKLTQENILESWCDAMRVPLSIFRLQNVYGPGQSPFNAYTGIITLFHRQAKAGKAIEIYEDGEIGRDFVFIDDVTDALLASFSKPPTGRRVIDVGTGTVTTINQAARFISKLYSAPEPTICGKFRDGDVRWAVADVTQLRGELGVSAKIPFETGCKLVGQWLSEKGHI
jgi:dTDP-L-rhamnose 4-epimerase